MIDCQKIQAALPWYVSGRLSPGKMRRMAAHISECELCRRELAQVVRIRQVFTEETERTTAPLTRVWESLTRALPDPPRARIDVGSFLIGLQLGVGIRGRQSAVRGDLAVLGHRIRIIGKRRKGA